jgi:hypothetical protein
MSKTCIVCGTPFMPRVYTHVYCTVRYRMDAKAAEGRSARRLWEAQGRPMVCEEVEGPELRQAGGHGQ